MNILHIDCSPRPQSYSRQLSAGIVKRLHAIDPMATVTRRDLGFEPIPHPGSDYAAFVSSPEALAAGPPGDAVRLSEQLIGEVEAADILVIGTPMNNFTVPSVFKAWIDQILRVGRTIEPTPAGKVGMLRDRPVLVGIASGGVFTGDGANQPDFLTPYLTAAFGCVGLASVRFLALQATAFRDPEQLMATRDALVAGIDLPVIGQIESDGPASALYSGVE